MPICKKCKDHLGNEFKTIEDMCTHWNISSGLYRVRIANGMPLEVALTTPVRKQVKYNAVDHKGVMYKSLIEMCAVYNVSRTTFISRINSGLSVEEALTRRLYTGNSKAITDHLGGEFPTVMSMCAKWGIKPSTYKMRIKLGWTVEEALTKPTRKRE